MAALYGRLQGSRGEATRCGTAASGMVSTVETWEGILETVLNADGSFYVYIMDKNRNGKHTVLTGNVNNQSAFAGVGVC